LNHGCAVDLNAPLACRDQPQVRFQAKAQMNRQARLVGSVESDPQRTFRARLSNVTKIGDRNRRMVFDAMSRRIWLARYPS
jgi:hypothetical protein